VLDWVSAGHAGLEPRVVSSDVQQVLRSDQGGRLNVEAEVTLPPWGDLGPLRVRIYAHGSTIE
jgi:hypothetical protein